ncbi:hypothetical protein CAT7_03569 [Carnobacterium sp. AT7]|uniref:DUF5626 family protein n=3 Tax=Carnobacteriaceae TaxID=186828 RepID=UPI00015F1747|nr:MULTISPECIES: DUF5626 family protein [Carnobacterium]EDP67192.1 hypothetical protein CAT7_03569 [Carnobacterium sp. AT7]
MKKIIFALSFFTIFTLNSTTKVQAEELLTTPVNSVSYDIDQGGLQEFEVGDSPDETYTITIEEEPQFSIMARGIKNNTYKVTKERALQWKVSYKIDIKGNSITKAHSPSINNYIGSVRNSSLKVDNSKQATYYINMIMLKLNSPVNVRATLQNNKIIVTY